MWGNPAWRGVLLEEKARQGDYLAHYARGLNAVEGNTSFYGLPSAANVRKWAERTPPEFRFCMKFPRVVSHERALVECEDEVARFLERLEPLKGRLGPLFLQLPPSLGPDRLKTLVAFLDALPRDYAYAVEVRHLGFFRDGYAAARLNDALAERGVDRVLFDTIRLQELQSDDSDVVEAQRKKPSVPRCLTVTGKRPFLRYVGDPDLDADEAGPRFWARRVAEWIQRGLTPYVFMHQVPDDDAAPELCRRFHAMLTEYLPELPPLPAWPCDTAPPEEEQLSLF